MVHLPLLALQEHVEQVMGENKGHPFQVWTLLLLCFLFLLRLSGGEMECGRPVELAKDSGLEGVGRGSTKIRKGVGMRLFQRRFFQFI